jgi:hypothetical protein
MRSQSVAHKIAKIFYEKIQPKTSLEAEDIYSIYVDCLNQACKSGYNSTILCPFMTEKPLDAANFHVQLINEIAFFTHIIEAPACLISGGPLDGSDDMNRKFLEGIKVNNLYTTDLTVFTISSNGDFMYFNGTNEIESQNLFAKEGVLHRKPLQLRGVLINSSNLRKTNL